MKKKNVKQFDDDPRAITCAKQTLLKKLLAPATAKWVNSNVVEKQPPHFIVFLSVDAQNGFGALIRRRYLVYVQLDEGDKFWNNPEGVQECGDPPTPDDIGFTKPRVGFPR